MWLKIHEGFHAHPKVLRAGNAGAGLWVRCANASAAYGLDGEIPSEVARQYGTPAEIRTVTQARLWVPTEHGYAIPDWLEYQPSAESWREFIAGQNDRARAGGRARAAAAKRDELGHFVGNGDQP